MAINDGGPAFPATRKEIVGSFQGATTYGYVEYPGMSLRDFFAGMAMMGMLANPEVHPGEAPGGDAECVQAFYSWADAMLAERAKGK